MSNDKNTLGAQARELRFIPDEASEKDSFGSHTKTADVIATVLQTRPNLRVVGLLGTWGSGKSTVLQFIKKNLEVESSEAPIFCFTYDAWLHQSDPPRRAFLEALIGFLVSKGLTSEGRWTDGISRLNRQVEDSETTTTPVLSTAGRYLLIPLFLVPLGLRLLDKSWLAATLDPGASVFERLLFPTGVLLVLLPFLIALGLWWSWRVARNPFRLNFWKRKNWKNVRPEHADDTLISIFANRHIQTQKNKVVRTPDPTTIEFQEIFRDVMEDISSHKLKPRLIFVIDNLDRMPEESAIEMWSTIRGLFLGDHQGFFLPTVILPVDEGAVRRMYSIEHGENETASQLAHSFMDKTFDLTFHVSPPVLSDWRQYATSQLRYAFGSHYQEEWSSIFGSIFDQHLAVRGSTRPVTPRQINTNINKIATLWLQWNSMGVSFSAITYYAINRESIDKDLIAFALNPNPLLDLLSSDWSRSISAMHYGVEPDRSEQVLIESALRQSIDVGDARTFTSLSTLNGFEQVLDRVLVNAISSQGSFNASRFVELYGALKASSDDEARPLWRRARALYTSPQLVPTFGKPDASALSILIEHCPVAEIDSFTSNVGKLINRLDAGALSKKGNVDGMVAAVRALISARLGASLAPQKIDFPASANLFVSSILTDPTNSDLAAHFNVDDEPDELADALIALLIGARPGSVLPALEALLRNGFVATWDNLISRAKEILDQGLGNGTAAASGVLAQLCSTQKSARNAVVELTDNGALASRFDEAIAAGNPTTASAIVAVTLLGPRLSTFQNPNNQEWTEFLQSFPTLLASLAQIIKTTRNGTHAYHLAKIGSASGMRPLASALFSHFLLDHTDMSPDLEDVASDYQKYFDTLNAGDDIKFIQLSSHSELFWETLDSSSIDDTSIILTIMVTEDWPLRSRALETALRKIQSLPAEKWEAALADSSPLYKLGKGVQDYTKTTKLTGPLFDVLKASISELTSTSKSDYRERWFSLSMLLGSSTRKTLARGLLSELLANDAPYGLSELLAAQSFWIINESDALKRANDVAVSLLAPLASTKDGLAFLSTNAEKFVAVLGASNSSAREEVSAQMSRVPEGDRPAGWENLVAKWNLPSPTAKPAEEEDTEKEEEEE